MKFPEFKRQDVRSLTFLSLILVVKAICAIIMISYAGINLSPDEAQYWTWSQNLDVGYYSKPPGIAWQIWAGCQLFGNTELGIRFGSVILSMLISLGMYILSRCAGLKPLTAMWSGIVMAFSPIGILLSFAAVTDGGFILFWIVTAAYFSYCLRKDIAPNYYILGLIIACGAIFKWPQIYYLWGVIVVMAYFLSRLRTFHIIGGIALSLAGIVPSLIWNASHEWANIRHIFNLLTGLGGQTQHHQLLNGNFLEFFGAQVGIVSPIYFAMLFLALCVMVRRGREFAPSLRFLGWTTLSLLILAGLRAILSKVQANWFICAYPTGMVLMSWYVMEYNKKCRPWILYGTVLSMLLSILVLVIPSVQSRNVAKIPYKFNAFQHSMGWDKLRDIIDDSGYDALQHFLFADTYQMSSILSFYGIEQKRAYFLNLRNNRKNQYSFWPGMKEEQQGNTGFFVVVDNGRDCKQDVGSRTEAYNVELYQYFSEVQFLGVHNLFEMSGETQKRVLIFKCIDYNGEYPPEIISY